jgi:proteasome assembly chaperone (PAC2) family protein
MADLVKIHRWPALERPLLVMALEGWIDAGLAAATAAGTLRNAFPHELLADFDPDELIDHRSRRPVLRIADGVHQRLSWPQIRLDVASTPAGRSLLLLTGPEPDMRWHRWSDEVVGLARRLRVEQVVGLGAFPAPVPHTRPIRLVSTGNDAEVVRQIGFVPVTVDVPAGAQGVLEVTLGLAGVPTLGLWARVPHYAAAMPYPAAAAALLRGLQDLTGIEVDTAALLDAAATTRNHIDRLIGGSEEHLAMVRKLEEQHDQDQQSSFAELPTGDEIAAELERFLRGQG